MVLIDESNPSGLKQKEETKKMNEIKNQAIHEYLQWEKALAIKVYSSHSKKSQILYFKLVTTFGSPGLWWIIMSIFLFYGIFLDRWYEYASFSGAYVFTMPIYLIVKAAVRRKRPFKVHEEIAPRGRAEAGASFPSGHSTFGALLYSYIGLFYFGGGLIMIPLFLMTLYIGYTRMVLGVHYLSDVIIGVLYGFTMGILYHFFMHAIWIDFVYEIF